MNDYFDQFERQAGTAVERRAHDPWYRRISHFRHSRVLAVIFATLLVATPAVGAVTNWFGLGAPDHFAKESPTEFSGTVLPGTSQLTALRVADPQGGPPWGLRVVRTTRGDTCVELGRVQNGELGSLGIDGAWDDDTLFHPFPNHSIGDDCGETDAVGDGFVNVSYTGQVANANPPSYAARIKSCRPPTLLTPRARGRTSAGTCPPGSVRFVFMGLLGPEAASITYLKPNGKLATEPTSGPYGAYLLVFSMNQRTCDLYTQGQNGGYGPCGSAEQLGGTSPSDVGAIKAVTYRSGKVCRLTIPAHDLAQQRALEALIDKDKLDGAAARKLYAALYQREHISASEAIAPTCPPVGYVAPKQKRITTDEVRAPLHVTITRASRWCARTGPYRPNRFTWTACDGSVPAGYQRIEMTGDSTTAPGILVDVSTTARVPVTSSRSWYSVQITDPKADGDRRDCGGGSGNNLGSGNVHAGQTLRTQAWQESGSCPGTYHGVISYVQSNNPDETGPGAGGGPSGEVGTAIVGRFTFRVP